VAARSIETQRSRIPSSVNKSPSSDGMLGAQSRNMEAEVYVEMLCGILDDKRANVDGTYLSGNIWFPLTVSIQ